MKKNNINEFLRGWFVGGFEPTLYKTTDVEVAIQRYRMGDKEPEHCHKVATEITAIVIGKARMGEFILGENEAITISPGEYTDFEAIEDTVAVVVKIPGVLNDKYLKND